MPETVSPRAGAPLPPGDLANIPRLVTAYFALRPDPETPAQRVAFGTSGHRGSSLTGSFNERHVLAITQAVCLHRARAGVTGPLFLGMDTHALSEPAFATALEVLAANGVETFIDAAGGYTPTPVISHAILTHNRGRTSGLADGVVISPSHNPPEEGGFKYNPPNGGPADRDVTDWIEGAANALLAADLRGLERIPFERARSAPCVHPHDYVGPYVADLAGVIDLERIRAAGVRIGVDPLGGAAVGYWAAVFERYGLDGALVNDAVDPTFRFMAADWDGKIRMDCSSPYAMAPLIALRDRYDIACANDADADRHGVVTPSGGLMKPNDFLATAVSYLCAHRPDWRPEAGIGKTVVSSALIDRVAASLGRPLVEVPVGFKWFTPGLMDGSLSFGGEESAGASFLRRDGGVWTTDKDGLIMGLLAAEMTAETGQDPSRLHGELTGRLGSFHYARIDAPASPAQKARLSKLAPADLPAGELAGDPIESKLSRAPGNDQPIGGIKVSTRNGWFAARPSGTENVYKIYAESFLGPGHLKEIQAEAQRLVDASLGAP